MKKFAFCALVAALVIALSVPALAETKIGGSYRVRGVYWDQGLDNGKFGGGALAGLSGTGRYFDNRLRLNIDSKVSDTVGVHVEADSGLGYNGHNGDFNNPAATPDSYDGIWNKGGSFVNLPDPLSADRDTTSTSAVGHDIVFQQAYMDFATPIGSFSIGRQWSFWGMGLMVGENRNRLAWSYQVPNFQIGAGYDKFFEGNNTATALGAFNKKDDQDNYFLWGLLNVNDNFQIGPYFEYTHADRANLNGTVLDRLGGVGADLDLDSVNTYGISIFANAKLMGFNLTAEGAWRGGSGVNPTGTDIDVNAFGAAGRATYAIDGVTLGLEGGYLSGQDPDETEEIQAFITPFSFSPFAMLGELAINGMDVLGNASTLTSYSDFCANMMYGKLFLQASPLPKLDAYLAIGYAATAEDRIVGTDKRNSLGTEVDLSLTYAITPNLTYNFTGGYLFLGDFYKDAPGFGTASPENAVLAVHSITINF